MGEEDAAEAHHGRPTPLGLIACVLAFLLPVAFSPLTDSIFWAPKWMLLLPLIGIGLPQLLLMASRPSPVRRSARFGLGLLVVAVLSTAFSPNPWMAVLGVYGFGTGLVFSVALVSAWAVGASLTSIDRTLLGRAVVAAGLVTSVACILEATVDLRAFDLGLYGGRTIGLQGNPVHVGPPVIAAFALLVGAFSRRPVVAAVPLLSIVVAAQTSGSRSALLALVVVAFWAMSRLTWSHRAGLVLVVLVGLVAGDALLEVRGGSSIS